ncbi:MAG: hypothetical protein OXM57_14590 [bacterium]|nr:hypothetical protein [bacterium]MDE0353906.1 hypothetical protein [bacterium]
MFSGRAARLAAAGVLVAAAVVLVLLFGRAPSPAVVGVLFASEPWPRGTAGEVVVIDVPESLAPLFVTPDGLGNSVAALDIPRGTFITAEMLRPPGPLPGQGELTSLRLAVASNLWPDPGPAGGDQAVVGVAAEACALAITELVDVEAGQGTVTVAVTPAVAVLLMTQPDLAVWPPVGETWPECLRPEPPEPIRTTPAGTTRLALAAATDLWPPPGPQTGDRAVVAPAADACALVVTDLLDVNAATGAVVVAADADDLAALRAAGDLSVWPAGSVAWPSCGPDRWRLHSGVPEGAFPLQILVNPTYFPPPGPGAGDLVAVGPASEGCAWLVAELLAAEGAAISLWVTPDVAIQLMAQPDLAVWSPTADGTWDMCADPPDALEPAPEPTPEAAPPPAEDTNESPGEGDG